MAETWIEKTGASPGKLALVGVLAVVLVGTVYFQWPSDGPSPSIDADASPLRPRREAGQTRTVAHQEQPESSDPQQVILPAWPRHTVAETLAHDPFLPPASMLPKPVTNSSAPGVPDVEPEQKPVDTFTTPDWMTQPVQVVVIGKDGPVAAIGSNVLRVGDVIDGLIVTEISEKGIVLTDNREGPRPRGVGKGTPGTGSGSGQIEPSKDQ